MTKRIACIQSSYIPWKGYFDIIQKSDLFVLYDCVQYTRRDWRNRNRIKTPHGLHWLTIPVTHESRDQRIGDVVCSDDGWKKRHWDSIRHHYSKAPYFKQYGEEICALFETCNAQQLSKVNSHFLQGICNILDVSTPMVLLTEQLATDGDKTDKLLTICQHHQATHYISGPNAKGYLEIDKFDKASIEVEWMDYGHYPEYPQLNPPFEHSVSVLDLLLNTGDSWRNYI